MTSLTERYGPTALIAGASEGLGAAWAHALAAQGFNLILIARRPEPLTEITRELIQKFGIEVLPLAIDLSAQNATHRQIAAVNMTYSAGPPPAFSAKEWSNVAAAVSVLMSSLAGLRGTGYLATYAASKAFGKSPCRIPLV